MSQPDVVAPVDPEKVVRGQQRVIEAQRAIIDGVRAVLDDWTARAAELEPVSGTQLISVDWINQRLRPILDGGV
jgi:hypothetical protein